MVDIVLRQPRCASSSLTRLANGRLAGGGGTVCDNPHGFKSNPLAMMYFPELHSQQQGNAQSCRDSDSGQHRLTS